MRYQFTPAAERALNCAYVWSSRNGYDELEAEALLLGLLAEPECRAAAMLARAAIDVPAVRQRWPKLVAKEHQDRAGGKPFSREVGLSVQFACERLSGFPRPLELATEHLLLGLVAADHEVSLWLRQRGLNPDALDAEIHRLYGYQSDSPIAAEPLTDTSRTELYARLEGGGEVASPTSESAAEIAVGPPNTVACQEVARREVACQEIATLRVLDAAANRAREGLRVVEDYVRFVLDDRHLTALCKQLRHDLTDELGRILPRRLLAARETQADVGTALSTPSEQTRGEMSAVLAANFARLQESLRSLEEFGKVAEASLGSSWGGSCTATPGATAQLSPQPPTQLSSQLPAAEAGLGDAFKQLRYRTYTLQRSVDITRHSIERLAAARLYVLIDGGPSAEAFERLASSLIAAGVHVLQLRDKRLGDRELLDRARLLCRLARNAGQASSLPNTENAGQAGSLSYPRPLAIINDRPDLAALAGADGVHVGQEELAVKDARSIVGPDALVGVSAHSIQQARQAVLDGADYIGVGPTFPSATKQFSQYPGAELLRAVAAEIRLPAFAIGGICQQNLNQVLSAGFTRIAVSSAIAASADPAAAARELLAALRSHAP